MRHRGGARVNAFATSLGKRQSSKETRMATLRGMRRDRRLARRRDKGATGLPYGRRARPLAGRMAPR
jgi:hypothetical protein